jgi:hypothetical protein
MCRRNFGLFSWKFLENSLYFVENTIEVTIEIVETFLCGLSYLPFKLLSLVFSRFEVHLHRYVSTLSFHYLIKKNHANLLLF